MRHNLGTRYLLASPGPASGWLSPGLTARGSARVFGPAARDKSGGRMSLASPWQRACVSIVTWAGYATPCCWYQWLLSLHKGWSHPWEYMVLGWEWRTGHICAAFVPLNQFGSSDDDEEGKRWTRVSLSMISQITLPIYIQFCLN